MRPPAINTVSPSPVGRTEVTSPLTTGANAELIVPEFFWKEKRWGRVIGVASFDAAIWLKLPPATIVSPTSPTSPTSANEETSPSSTVRTRRPTLSARTCSGPQPEECDAK